MDKFSIIKPNEVRKPRRRVNKVFIHCSATDFNARERYQGRRLAFTIDLWHRDRGWNEIGYHYVLDKNGVLVTGRDVEKIPAAQARHNVGSIAICVHGLIEELFTEAQFETLREFCKQYNKLYDGKLTFHGHREVAAKACPVFDYKKVLKLDKDGKLGL